MYLLLGQGLQVRANVANLFEITIRPATHIYVNLCMLSYILFKRTEIPQNQVWGDALRPLFHSYLGLLYI